jgi:hypothetical protein
MKDETIHRIFVIGLPLAVVIGLLLGAGCSTLDAIIADLPDSQPGAVQPTPDTPTTPDGPPAPSPSVQIAVSWTHKAADREMNKSAVTVSLAEFKAYVDGRIAMGCNTLNLYVFNFRDGSPVPSTIYREISPERVALLRAKAEYALSKGMMINWWIYADDGGGIKYNDTAWMKQGITDTAAQLGDIIRRSGGYVVPVLESNECLDGLNRLTPLTAHIKAVLPGVRVANHMTSGRKDWSLADPNVDCLFMQEELELSVGEFTARTKSAVSDAKAKGKTVVACEFSLIGTDETARTKARIALDAWCVGVHSGVPK